MVVHLVDVVVDVDAGGDVDGDVVSLFPFIIYIYILIVFLS
jgi:hypothetical protein